MKPAFDLEVGQDGLATLTFDHPDKRVNVFDRAVLEELERTIDRAADRGDIGILVLLSGKASGFIAGADVGLIAEVADPLAAEAGARLGQRVFAAWESLPFPTVAAIDGVCLGGGTEMALASTYRVASDADATKIGLPEIKLGIVPGWGGSTRLPRLVGVEQALDMILTGKNVRAKKAGRIGLVDAVLPAARFLDAVRDFASQRIGTPRPKEGVFAGFDLKELLLEKNPLGRKILFDQARKQTLAKTGGHYPAATEALDVVRTGLEDGLRAGFDAEARAVGALATGPVAKNLIHVFRLMEGAKKQQGVPGGDAREVGSVAILGAGVMGGGVAQLVADQAGVPVRMKDIQPEALAHGMEHAAEVFEKQVSRRRLTPEAKRRKMALIRPTLDYSGFPRTDVVVEAIVEKLPVKQKVFAEVAAHVGDETVLASNTSSLSIDAIAADTPHPERVVGMHFFNPVDKMPLIEVIAGERSAPWAVNTIFALSRRLGKTPILVKDAPGFLVNRLLTMSLAEAFWLLDEGYRIEDLDRAMKGWGMPMGPIALTDEVGIDVAMKVAHILHEAFGERLPLPVWVDGVQGDDRLGAKNGRGFYLYEDGKRDAPDPEVYDLLGLEPRIADPDPDRMVDRMVLPMVDEAARCLEEEVVRTPGDVDLAMILGTGFPPFRGGLCRWADNRGTKEIVATLDGLADTVGERYRPSDALRETAAGGGFYTHWQGAAESPGAGPQAQTG